MSELKRFALGVAVAAWILFVGHMCGAPIVSASPDNFVHYVFATVAGAFAWLVSTESSP